MITVEELKRIRDTRKRDDAQSIDLFGSLFPDGFVVTKENCVRYAQDFNWEWAAEHLFDRHYLSLYEAALRPESAIFEDIFEDARRKKVRSNDQVAFDNTMHKARSNYLIASARKFAEIYSMRNMYETP